MSMYYNVQDNKWQLGPRISSSVDSYQIFNCSVYENSLLVEAFRDSAPTMYNTDIESGSVQGSDWHGLQKPWHFQRNLVQYNPGLSYVGGLLEPMEVSGGNVFHEDASQDKWTKMGMGLKLRQGTIMSNVCVL